MMQRRHVSLRRTIVALLAVVVGLALLVIGAVVRRLDDPRVVMLVKLEPDATRAQGSETLGRSVAVASTSVDLLLVMISPSDERSAVGETTSTVRTSTTTTNTSTSTSVTSPALADLPSIAFGSTGGVVVQLKAMLRLIFPDVGLPPDDRFDKMTDVLVRRFQSEQGLLADGIVGERSWTELQRLVDARRAASPRGRPPVGQDPPSAGSPSSALELDDVRQLLRGASVPTAIVVEEELGTVIATLGGAKVVDSEGRTLQSPARGWITATLWLAAASCLAGGAVAWLIGRGPVTSPSPAAYQPVAGGVGGLVERRGQGDDGVSIEFDRGRLDSPEEESRPWHEDPIATATLTDPGSVPQDAAPAAGISFYLTGSPEDQYQCPSCGAFAVQGPSGSRRGLTATTFTCASCAFLWTWEQGTPWPRTVVRAFRPLEEP